MEIARVSIVPLSFPPREQSPKAQPCAADVRFLASVAPGATFEERNSLRLRSLAGQTVMLDRAVIVDRSTLYASRSRARCGVMLKYIRPASPQRLLTLPMDWRINGER